jgi:alpha-tubulin suppressor-like RCC1 family protein
MRRTRGGLRGGGTTVVALGTVATVVLLISSQAVAAPAWASKVVKPTISMAATPSVVDSVNGEATVSATVTSASYCELSVTPVRTTSPASFYPSPTVDCSHGSFTAAVRFPTNLFKKSVTYKLSLLAYANFGNATKTKSIKVSVDPGDGGSPPLTGASHAVLTGATSCAIVASGGVDCWGDGYFGQLGDYGNITKSATPQQVLGVGGIGTLVGAVSLAATPYVECALLGSGGVDCWGRGDGGQTGSGPGGGGSWVPSPVVGIGGTGTLSGATSLVALNSGFCAILDTGSVSCWGGNSFGELGDGSTTERDAPVRVLDVTGGGYLSGVASLVAFGDSARETVCAVLSDGGVDCWGSNGNGQLGNGTTTSSLSPVPVLGVGGGGLLTEVTSLTASSSGTVCALLSSTGVDCWGNNDYGQLGDGSTTDANTPVEVVDAAGSGTLAGVTSMAVAYRTFCAVLSSGGVDCWGLMYPGSTPVPMVGTGGVGVLAGVRSLSGALNSFCAALASGGVDCWGYGPYGELGNGSGSPQSSTPLPVVGVGQVGVLMGTVAVTSSGSNVCAMLTSGGMDCWGNGDFGQLGDGNFYSTGRLGNGTPVQVLSP